MEKKLYIGNLSYNLTEDQLKETFGQAGTVVSASIITDKYSGRSKGFGFVEMSTEDEAAKAIEMFNNKEMDGRSLKVSEARPREERPRTSGGSRGGYGGGSRGGYGGGSSRGGYGRDN
ncbi:MAG: RNA-binding protein [Patescibacteria group bacterium]|nr:RNA-binding protein [Patescibacteria group bacterium]MDD5164431.1 RNA-binding protein [Patescibacteria group bacterium]MDD5534592.1 RNA-binding protein [Patescibacteria group bacterium]